MVTATAIGALFVPRGSDRSSVPDRRRRSGRLSRVSHKRGLVVTSNLPELPEVGVFERDLLGPTVVGLVDRLVKEGARSDDGEPEAEQDR